jgi:hypothetical protein
MEFPVEEGGTADDGLCTPLAAAAVVRPQSPELASVRNTHRPAALDGGPERSPIARSAPKPSRGCSLS